MSEFDWVPPRWFFKSVSKDMKDQLSSRPVKTKVKVATPRNLFTPAQTQEEQLPCLDAFVSKLKQDSDSAKQLLSEFGLDGISKEKNP